MPFDPIVALAFFVFGLVFGSFANVCIHRLPRRILAQDELAELDRQPPADQPSAERERLRAELRASSVVGPRSACPACKTQIRWYDNIPLLSWLLLGGRCRHCRAPISLRYPAVELLTALLFLACYARFGATLAAAKFCLLSFLLVALIFTDARWRLLPDALTFPGLGLGLAFSFAVPVNDAFLRMLAGMGLPVAARSPALASFLQALAGAAAGASFIYGAGMIYKRARGVEGMGLGDAKLMAMIGAFVGVGLTVFTLFTASLLGSVFGLATVLSVWVRRTRRRMTRRSEPFAAARRHAWRSAVLVYRHFELPFGVFLGSMALAAAFFGNALMAWYWERFP